MHLIVGLGNPGPKYLLTRHNIGFLALDQFAQSLQINQWKKDFKSEYIKAKIDDAEVILLKPQTFMNLSGEAVQQAMAFFKVDLNNLLIIHDDIDQSFKSLRFHFDRGSGGHNGIKSTHEKLGTSAYARLKLGVGRPHVPQMDVASYVLQNFSEDEQQILPEYLNTVGDAIECFIFEGLTKAASKFNGKVEE